MATGTIEAAPVLATKAKVVKSAAVSRTKKPSTHPTWTVMLHSAIKALNERGGSSIPAIKKYILANHLVDPDRASSHMKRGLLAALTAGTIVQVKGKGMSGSFKLGGATKSAAKKPKAVGEQKKVVKKAASPKKSVAKPKKTTKPVAASGEVKPKTAKSAAKPKAAKPAKKAASPKKAKAPAKPKIAKKPASPKKAKAAKAKAPKSPKAPKPKTTKPKAAAKPKAAPKKA